MHDDIRRFLPMIQQMLSNALRSLPHHRLRHDVRLTAPALVGGVVHVTVVAIDVAPAVYLEEECVKWDHNWLRVKGRQRLRAHVVSLVARTTMSRMDVVTRSDE